MVEFQFIFLEEIGGKVVVQWSIWEKWARVEVDLGENGRILVYIFGGNWRKIGGLVVDLVEKGFEEVDLGEKFVVGVG